MIPKLKSTGHRQIAFVVGTAHDRATKYLQPILKEAEKVLEESGYEVLSLYGADATCPNIYVNLCELKRARSRVKVVVVGAHGSDTGLYRHGDEVLIDPTVCEQLTRSVLILLSCLEHGGFPESCTKNKKQATACIGFRNKLYIPRPKWWSKILGNISARESASELGACLLQPVRSLVKKRTVKQATSDAKTVWDAAATSTLSKDWRIAFVFEANGQNLDCWGNGSARLAEDVTNV